MDVSYIVKIYRVNNFIDKFYKKHGYKINITDSGSISQWTNVYDKETTEKRIDGSILTKTEPVLQIIGKYRDSSDFTRIHYVEENYYLQSGFCLVDETWYYEEENKDDEYLKELSSEFTRRFDLRRIGG